MSEFRLLDKFEINKRKSEETRKLVEEGVKLAKSVDILRETYSTEQTKLRLFRENTLKAIKDELDVLVNKKNALNSKIAALEEVLQTKQTH